MSTCNDPEKIAILGGGMGALSAAYELSDPKLGKQYDITVYQIGWRLGGKGASGRNPYSHDRIEEHGIHAFMGFYDNAFDLMQRCYKELNRPRTAPLSTWDKAFVPHEHIFLEEQINGKWDPWPFRFPPLPGTPGKGSKPPSLWALVRAMLDWLLGYTDDITNLLPPAAVSAARKILSPLPPWWTAAISTQASPATRKEKNAAKLAIRTAIDIAAALPADPRGHPAEARQHIQALLRQALQLLWQTVSPYVQTRKKLRRYWIIFEFILTVTRGVLIDRLLEGKFNALNKYDFREWLRGHGASTLLLDSVLIRAFYDLVFAYPDGNDKRAGNLEAGSHLRLLLNGFRYRGGAFWKMQAGMGDVVFAPLYEVLKKRGVKFKFFHRVTGIHRAPGTRTIDRITISRQVNIKPGGYDPLVCVKKLPCWPSFPRYGLIKEGAELERNCIDLESYWVDWRDRGGDLTLYAGENFDKVILGIPVGSFPDLCGDLIEEHPDWQAMVDNLPTVQTHCVQLWLKPDLKKMGWKKPKPILGTYHVTPMSNWADMSQVLPFETWNPGKCCNVSYLCGMLKGPSTIADPNDITVPQTRRNQIDSIAGDFYNRHTGGLWPGATNPNGTFNGRLVADKPYRRVNINPSDRYVQSFKGSSEHKLGAANSGFKRLYLAGDWIDNGLNIGCIEGAVIAGRHAARAVSDLDIPVCREKPPDGWKAPPAPFSPAHGISPPPKYVPHGGMQVFPPPVVFTNATMHAFALKGRRTAIQDLCDRMFRDPSGGAVYLVPLSGRVLLTFVDLPHGTFSSAPQFGWGKERDVALWILAAMFRRTERGYKYERLMAFAPYLFVDNGPGLVSGREVFGFQKAWGVSRMPRKPTKKNPFRVDTFTIEKYGAGSEVRLRTLMELYPVSAGKAKSLGTLARMVSGGMLLDVLVGGRKERAAKGPLRLPRKKILLDIARALRTRQMPAVFLKQFLEVDGSTDACYQAITQAPLRVTKRRGITPARPHWFKLHAMASHPIQADLGVGNQIALWCARIPLDFEQCPGGIVWRAKP